MNNTHLNTSGIQCCSMLMYIALCAAADLSVAVEEMATYLINSFGQRDEDEIGKFILLFLF